MSRRIEKNWKWIQAQYETGLPLRKIAELYGKCFPGEGVSHQNISSYARRHGWSRDKLVDSYRAETKRKVKEKMAAQTPQGRGVKRPDDGKSLEVHEAEVVALNSDLASEIEIKHRELGNYALTACRKILADIVDNVAANVADRDGNVHPVTMPPAAKAKALKDLLYAIEKAVAIERKSWNMDTAKGNIGGESNFNVLINVPDPDPLPEQFRYISHDRATPPKLIQ
jgi:hypothetical protein